MTLSTTSLPADQAAALGRGFDGFDLRAASRDGVSLGYRIAGDGPPVVLVHGYPQSGFSWRTAAADLARDHRVVVPDYRGAAGSDVPAGGYDKETMAHDLAAVITDVDTSAIHVVGHDIGMMVAYAYARLYAPTTRTLTLIDAILPGVPSFAALIGTMGLWHFGFNSQVDLATTLVTGSERAFFDWYFDHFSADPGVIPDADRDFYAAAAQRPNAVAAGFRLYDAMVTVDAAANEAALADTGKLAMPVLGIGGAYSTGPVIGTVISEVASNTRDLSIDGAGHYLPEEQPAALASALRKFVTEHSA